MMSETSGRRRVHKARRNPTPAYSSTVPSLSTELDVLYRIGHPEALNEYESKRADRIVTSQTIYKPAILASARITFVGTRWSLHHESDITKIVSFPIKRQICQWDEDLSFNWSSQEGRSDPEPSSLFVSASDYDFSTEHFEELQEDFLQYLLATETFKVEYNPVFKLHRKLDEAQENFANRCMDRAREELTQEMNQLEDTMQRLSDRLKQRLEREVRENTDAAELSSARHSSEFDIQEEIEAHDSKRTMEDIRKEMQELDQVRALKMKEFEERLESVAQQREAEVFRLNRSNAHILQFRLIWLPYREYIIQDEHERRVEMVRAF